MKKLKPKVKIILISGTLLVFIILLILYSNNKYKALNDIKKDLNNKETFLMVISNSEYQTENRKKILKYYAKAYNLKYIYINAEDWTPKHYDKLLGYIKADKETTKPPCLIYIKEGTLKATTNNVIDESIMKEFLVNNEIIKKEYIEKDYLLNDNEFKDFINDKEGNILFYAKNDQDIYEYRTRLLKAGAKYGIIYAERNNNAETEETLRKMLKLPSDKEFDLPMLIKFKSGKVIDYKDNIAINRVAKVYKDLEKK